MSFVVFVFVFVFVFVLESHMFVCGHWTAQGGEEYSFVSRINCILLRQAQRGGVSESGHVTLFGLLPSLRFGRKYEEYFLDC